jgi:hypothetical protein
MIMADNGNNRRVFIWVNGLDFRFSKGTKFCILLPVVKNTSYRVVCPFGKHSIIHYLCIRTINLVNHEAKCRKFRQLDPDHPGRCHSFSWLLLPDVVGFDRPGTHSYRYIPVLPGVLSL